MARGKFRAQTRRLEGRLPTERLPAETSSAKLAWIGAAAVLAVLAGLLAGVPALAGSSAVPKPALELQSDAVAHGAMVALGRDVVVAGEARNDVAAVDGSVRVSGTVLGDVLALGGDVHLAASARVEGEVFVLGGSLEMSPGAQVRGRTVAYPDVPRSWLALVEGPVLGLDPTSATVLAAKAALLCGWAVVLLLVFAVASRELVVTSQAVWDRPFEGFFVGLGSILSLLLAALLLASFAGPLVGVPMVVVLVLVALLLKLWGQVAVFHAVGERLLRRPQGQQTRVSPVSAASLGLLTLGVLRFVPYLGSWVWMGATLVGVGAAISSRLGRSP